MDICLNLNDRTYIFSMQCYHRNPLLTCYKKKPHGSRFSKESPVTIGFYTFKFVTSHHSHLPINSGVEIYFNFLSYSLHLPISTRVYHCEETNNVINNTMRSEREKKNHKKLDLNVMHIAWRTETGITCPFYHLL